MCGNRSWHTYAMHSVLPLKPGVTATELGKNCLEVRAWGKGRGRAGLGMNMGGVGGGGGGVDEVFATLGIQDERERLGKRNSGRGRH
jgi:hypothetical protein